MKSKHLLLLTFFSFLFSCTSNAQKETENEKKSEIYTFKKKSYDGIGKFYKGREIAHVMGYQGINWLERSEREKEERTSILLKNMDIQNSDVIADIGAGAGYHTFQMAQMASKGNVFAVDIQREMLTAMKARMKRNGVSNVTLIKGEEETTNLPENTIDKALLVDVYHEFSFPKEMMLSLKKALKVDGKIYLIEYRAEDPTVPIKEIHKMTERQAVKEMKAIGLKLESNIDNLPWQHCMVFVKDS